MCCGDPVHTHAHLTDLSRKRPRTRLPAVSAHTPLKIVRSPDTDAHRAEVYATQGGAAPASTARLNHDLHSRPSSRPSNSAGGPNSTLTCSPSTLRVDSSFRQCLSLSLTVWKLFAKSAKTAPAGATSEPEERLINYLVTM